MLDPTLKIWVTGALCTWRIANCWVGFWYPRDFGRRIKNPKVTPNPKTQCGQKGQSFSLVEQYPAWISHVWAAPTVVPKHRSLYLRSQTSKATETHPRHLSVTQGKPERDQKAGACSGKKTGALIVSCRITAHNHPSAVTFRTSQPLPSP